MLHRLGNLRKNAKDSVKERMPHVISDGADIQAWARRDLYRAYNRGVMNEPRLIAQVTTAQGGNRALLSHAGGRRVISEDVANRLESEMTRVVKSGTGKRAALDNGYTVAGKTGSAEASNDKSIESHAWFVGYITNDNAPYAVCVLVENGGSGGGVAGYGIGRGDVGIRPVIDVQMDALRALEEHALAFAPCLFKLGGHVRQMRDDARRDGHHFIEHGVNRQGFNAVQRR